MFHHSECEKCGNPDIVFEFASTSKVSFPGGGISAIAASEKNLEYIKKSMTIMTIGYDKINQLRHARFFKDIEGLNAHMMKHAASIRCSAIYFASNNFSTLTSFTQRTNIAVAFFSSSGVGKVGAIYCWLLWRYCKSSQWKCGKMGFHWS